MIHSIQVENIKCGGCMNSIKAALQKIDSVEDVLINKEEQMVSVTGNVDKAVLVKKLSSLGYPEKGNNSLLKKAVSYVSCATGRMKES